MAIRSTSSIFSTASLISVVLAYIAGEITEPSVQEMEDFSYQTTIDTRLKWLRSQLKCWWPSQIHVRSDGCRAYPANSLTALLQPPDHMSELIVLILNEIQKLIDFALDIIMFSQCSLTDSWRVAANPIDKPM